jgi:hypothetical protein
VKVIDITYNILPLVKDQTAALKIANGTLSCPEIGLHKMCKNDSSK